jgi:hypothetical protein
MPLIFSPQQLETQRLLRTAVDPHGLANPGKILPAGRGCTESGFRNSDHLKRTESILGLSEQKKRGVSGKETPL